MMTTLKDSSEIHEAARLFHELSKPVSQGPLLMLTPDEEEEVEGLRIASVWLRVTSVIDVDEGAKAPELPKGTKIEDSLVAICERGGFFGAVVAEMSELPVAVFRSHPGHQAVAAFLNAYSQMLPEAMSILRAARTFGYSLAINERDKAVVRRFDVNDIPHYLMVFCPKMTDERVEIESSISHIISIIVHESLVNR